jgi:hypothetical protein
VKASVLKLPDFDKDFEIHFDAFDFAIGGVLVQEGRPVAFENKKLSETERRWPTHEKEMWVVIHCRNPTLAKCEDETPTPKVGGLEPSGTLEFLDFNRKGKNTSPWGVLGVTRKVLKCRCLKWPRIGHLNICSPSYEQKKGRESNWQFDSRPLKVGNRPAPDVRWGNATRRWKALREGYKFG